MKRVLIADRLPDQCQAILREAGLETQVRPGLGEQELADAVRGANGIICRSGVRITEAVLDAADRLEAICRAGVGVDNIDLAAASRRGVVVMNTPGANAVSTAEHAFALLLGLARNIGPAYIAMREGRWDRSRFVGSQLSGATLGIVGLGRVGQEVAKRAAGSGMRVIALDPDVNRRTASRLGVSLVGTLEELLKESDYVTVHVPENEQTRGLIGPEQIALMRPGACIINCARGSVVQQDAVVAAVKEGRLGGAAFDVYEKEPPDDYEFARHDRILATPHLGASTGEAQLAVATQAAEQLAEALLEGRFRNVVNLGFVPPEDGSAVRPYCDLVAQLGKLVGQLAPGQPEALHVTCWGEFSDDSVDPIVYHGVMGFMQSRLGEHVNIVSAAYLAEERGIRISTARMSRAPSGLANLVELELVTDVRSVNTAGTLFGREHPRIVRIAGFDVEVLPRGHLLVVFNNDMPGCIGAVGGALGEARINVARMSVSRQQVGGNALLAFNLDSPCPPETLRRIRALELVQEAVPVEL